MPSPEERFWSKVDKTGECWLWTASLVNAKGYGYFWTGSRGTYAHRFAYELAVGVIPEGLQVDHRPTCPKRCVRPDHLRLVTNKQNCENRAGPYRNSQSGVRGVCWDKSRKRWRASVGHHGQIIEAGYFDSIEDAEAAVVAKRLELYTHNDLDRLTLD